MALIKCKECGKEVSSSAKACPNCGHAPPKRTSGCAWVVAAFFLVVVIMVIVGNRDIAKKENAEAARLAALTPEQRNAELAAAAATKERGSARFACELLTKKTLHDPDSAEFENSDTFPIRRLADHEYMVRVKVRAKNGFNALRLADMNCHIVLRDGNWIALSIEQIE
jgi:hypothetical protein